MLQAMAARVEPGDPIDVAILLDATIAMGRDDEVALAWAQFGLGKQLTAPVARLAAARCLLAAGAWRRGVEELWRVELTEPGRGEEVAIARAGLLLSCAPLAELEAALGERVAADHVLSTIPMPLIPKLIPTLPEALRARYAALRNIGAVCVIHKLRRPVTGNFWLNTNDARIEVPGLVEFSNLRPFADGTHIVYVPYYMPQTQPKFARDDDFFVRESFGYLQLVNPQLTDADRLDSAVGRLQYAQPLCPPGFAAMLPDIVTPIRGLQIADTSSYYPEDRGIAESARVAQEMAARVGA